MNYPTLSLMQAKEAVRDGIECREPTLLLGQPGIGKTEMVAQLSAEIGKLFVPVEAGLIPDEELGGLFRFNHQTGRVERVPITVIRQACEQACVLFLDEITRCTLQRQGVLMTITNERRIGDFQLHPETVVVLAGNGGESAGTHGVVDALLNRCNVVEVVAKRSEVISYLKQIGTAASAPVVDPNTGAVLMPGSSGTLRELGIDYAATAERRVDLIAEAMPKGAADSGILWPSPRAVVKALKRLAVRVDGGRDITSEVGFAALAGNMGNEAAAAYITVRKLRNKLPTVEDIVKDPKTAKIPPDTESGIAALGLIANAAEKNADSAWLYTGRLQDAETQAAITRNMLSKMPKTPDALAVFQKLAGGAARAMKRTGGV